MKYAAVNRYTYVSTGVQPPSIISTLELINEHAHAETVTNVPIWAITVEYFFALCDRRLFDIFIRRAVLEVWKTDTKVILLEISSKKNGIDNNRCRFYSCDFKKCD